MRLTKYGKEQTEKIVDWNKKGGTQCSEYFEKSAICGSCIFVYVSNAKLWNILPFETINHHLAIFSIYLELCGTVELLMMNVFAE